MSAKTGNSIKIDFNTAESWESARAVAARLGNMPTTFAGTIRALLQDHEKKSSLISPATRFHVTRLTKGPGMNSILYYAALTFYEEKVNSCASLTIDEMVDFFRPVDLAAIFGFAYYYRRAKKLVAEDEWEFISNPVLRQLELGGFVGLSLPDFGLGHGMLIGGLSYLAFAAFHLTNKKLFTEYRRHLKMKSLPVDFVEEIKRWECTSVQVGSILMQSTGFGVAYANAFLKALTPGTKDEEMESDALALKFKALSKWVRAIDKTGSALTQEQAGLFYPEAKALEKLLSETANVRNNESKYHWLAKGKDDIGPEITPKLFKRKGADKPPTEVIEADVPLDELAAEGVPAAEETEEAAPVGAISEAE